MEGEEGEITVPRNCSGNYCSQCYFNAEIRDYRSHLMSYNDNRFVVRNNVLYDLQLVVYLSQLTTLAQCWKL